jgi:hypothetical protein
LHVSSSKVHGYLSAAPSFTPYSPAALSPPHFECRYHPDGKTHLFLSHNWPNKVWPVNVHKGTGALGDDGKRTCCMDKGPNRERCESPVHAASLRVSTSTSPLFSSKSGLSGLVNPLRRAQRWTTLIGMRKVQRVQQLAAKKTTYGPAPRRHLASRGAGRTRQSMTRMTRYTLALDLMQDSEAA